MIAQVLERLETLQARLAALDPSREMDAADRVGSIAAALRNLLVEETAETAPAARFEEPLRAVA